MDDDHAANSAYPTTQILGYFSLRGDADDNPDDELVTATIEVPARSPLATLARSISRDPACPCWADRQQCLALNETSLQSALEHATWQN